VAEGVGARLEQWRAEKEQQSASRQGRQEQKEHAA
jgi:hypothetical protein